MRAGIAALVAGYVLSQFYRAFLAVLAQVLKDDLGADAGDLSRASGLWFLTFALMQIPVGLALDRIGPRRTTSVLLALGGGGGAMLFATAQDPAQVQWAMALIGAGCAPVLMASYYIFVRSFPPALFATLGALVVAGGSLGNVAGSIPLAWLVEAVGWRAALWGLVAATLAVAALIALAVQDPPRHADAHLGGSLLSILASPGLWPALPLLCLNYVIPATLRGLWVGPFLTDRYGLDAEQVGWAVLLLGVAMIAGSLAYGPLDRLFGTRKWVILAGNLAAGLTMVALALWTGAPLWGALGLISLAGLFSASFALVIAHGRAFAPPHLAGRAVTLLNLFSIGGAGIFQYASGQVHALSGGSWTVLFLFFGLPIVAACLLLAFARDNMG